MKVNWKKLNWYNQEKETIRNEANDTRSEKENMRKNRYNSFKFDSTTENMNIPYLTAIQIVELTIPPY